MGICEHCSDNIEHCYWKTYREDLIRYWLECRQRGRSFGDLGMVSEINLHARKVSYIKYNSLVGLPVDTPCPACVVVGLSFLFPSKKFQDGTELPDFIENAQRDGHSPNKKKRVVVDISVNKYNFE